MIRLIPSVVFFCYVVHLYSDAVPVRGHYILPKKAGYIPVYVRHGNMSLNEINANLADAFHENIETEYLHTLKDIKYVSDSSSSEESNESSERYKVRTHFRNDKDDTSESSESSEEIKDGNIQTRFLSGSVFGSHTEVKAPARPKRSASTTAGGSNAGTKLIHDIQSVVSERK